MAENSYPRELAAWVEKQTTRTRRQDAATVAFLAVRGDVKAAMGSGYAVTTIYRHMRETGRVKCSYETFRKHVQRYIKGGAASLTPAPRAANQAKPMQQEGNTKARTPESPGIAGFKYNPKPNKEDLL